MHSEDAGGVWSCEECAQEGLEVGRRCGLEKLPQKLGPLECGIGVWKEDDGSFRYDLSECPISIMGRYRAELATASHWRLLGSFPHSFDDVDLAFWQTTSAIYSEGTWFSNQPSTKGRST